MCSTRPTASPTPGDGCASMRTRTSPRTGEYRQSRCGRCAALEVPELVSLEANRKLVKKIEAAVGAAYADIANVDEVLVLINHYPLRNVGWRHSLQSENPRSLKRSRN